MKKIAISAGLASLLLAAPAAAQSRQQQQNRQQQSRQQQSDATQSQFYRVRGNLTDLRTEDVNGEEHLIAKLRMESGKNVFLDLGKASELRRARVRFQRDQPMTAMGERGRTIDGARVFKINHFRTPDGMVVMIQPQGIKTGRCRDLGGQQGFGGQQAQGQQRMRGQQSGSLPAGAPRGQRAQRQMAQNMIAVGTIKEARALGIKGVQDDHIIGKLQLESGKTIVVDLGTRADLRDVKLQKGERIGVIGSMGRINDKPVLVADMVGDLVAIQRTHELRQRSMQTEQGERLRMGDRSQRDRSQRDRRNRDRSQRDRRNRERGSRSSEQY